MKILLFTDLHIHNWKSFGVDAATGIPRRLQDQLDANDQILKIASDEKVDLAICGGDVYHSRGNIPVVAMNFVEDFFSKLSGIAQVFLVRGNHDLVSDQNYKSHCDALTPLDRDTGRKKEVVYGSTKIRFVDYYEEIDVDAIKGYDIVVLHKQPAITNEFGFKFEGIDYRILAKNNKFVFFGHYHAKKILGGATANCFVMGSVIPLTFGDSGEHGVWILDTVVNSVKFIKLQYPEFITVDSPEEVKDDKNYYRVLHAVKKSDNENVVSVIVPEYFDERIKASDFRAIMAEWLQVNGKTDYSYMTLLDNVIGSQQVEVEKNLFKGKLEHVEIKDFISVGSIDLDIQNGFTLVTGKNELGGSNGSGKSSIFDGIYWCLFGETTKGLTGNDVVRRGAKDCIVELTLNVGGNTSTIRRSRKNGLELSNDVVNGMRQADRQKYLETHILGFDKTLYLTSCYFSQEQLQTLTELSDVDRTNMMTGLLGFDIYDKLYDTVKKHIDESQDKVEALNTDYQDKQNKANLLMTESIGIKDKIDLVTETVNEKKDFIKITNKEIDAIVDTSIDFDAKLKEIADEEKLMLAQQESGDFKLTVLNEELVEYSRKISSLNTEVRLTEKNIIELESKVSGVRMQTLGERCDTCGSLVTPENVEAYAQVKLTEVTALLTKSDGVRVKSETLESEKLELTTAITTLKSKLLIIKKSLSDLRSQVQVVNNNKLEHQKKEILSKSVDSAFAEIENCRIKIKDYEAKKGKLTTSIDNLNKDLVNISTQMEQVEEDTEKMEFWKKAFSPTGVKSLLLDRFCNEFNQLANEYISTISTGSMSILISPTKTLKSGEERNKIGIDVQFNGFTVAYESLSGGEKKRVDIALCLSLNKWVALRHKLSSSGLLGFIVLDEVFAFLDTLGEEAIGTLLYKEGQDKAVYVISHTNELNSYCFSSICVKKVDGVSTLILGGE